MGVSIRVRGIGDSEEMDDETKEICDTEQISEDLVVCLNKGKLNHMNKIKKNGIIGSVCKAVPSNKLRFYKEVCKTPEIGDIVYGEVSLLGQHKTIESCGARIHQIQESTRVVLVFGNRYAPDYYEAFVPTDSLFNNEPNTPNVQDNTVDLIARSGLVGLVNTKKNSVGSPTRVKILGYVCDKDGKLMNTKDYVLLKPKTHIKSKRRAKIILSVGTAMNSGKTYTAAACCYTLSSMGKNVRAAKITGTASLKDILLMEDCGASHIADFTYFGFPSTYMLSDEELFHIFHSVDRKYGNNPKNYLVLEFADGILQRETLKLLKMKAVRDRLHKIIFSAQDAFGACAGIDLCKKLGFTPDAVSGVITGSPLMVREFQELSDVPVMYNSAIDTKAIYNLIK